jgi:hypothetical protein
MHRGNRHARTERIAERLCQTRRVATATSSVQCKRTPQPRCIRFGTFHKVCARLLCYLASAKEEGDIDAGQFRHAFDRIVATVRRRNAVGPGA